jgi:hypothetical protein
MFLSAVHFSEIWLEDVLGKTQKGTLTVYNMIASALRFCHFVAESEGEVQTLMLYLHGLILLMAFSMILGRRLVG